MTFSFLFHNVGPNDYCIVWVLCYNLLGKMLSSHLHTSAPQTSLATRLCVHLQTATSNNRTTALSAPQRTQMSRKTRLCVRFHATTSAIEPPKSRSLGRARPEPSRVWGLRLSLILL